jgi:hypothetical protein
MQSKGVVRVASMGSLLGSCQSLSTRQSEVYRGLYVVVSVAFVCRVTLYARERERPDTRTSLDQIAVSGSISSSSISDAY